MTCIVGIARNGHVWIGERTDKEVIGFFRNVVPVG